jgi:hypothetical protein
MSKPFSVLFKSAFTILFACSAIPAFAQRGAGGGGGHMGGVGGGGFHGGGGGGFHGGGGMPPSGGGGFHGGGMPPTGGGMRPSAGGGFRGGSFSPPSAGYTGPRAAAPYASRSVGGYSVRPGNSYSRPGGNFAGGNERFGNSSSAPPRAPQGQWHSFGGPAGGRGPSGAQSEARTPGNAGGFHVFSGNRGAGSPGTVRSFSGQGGEVWENAPAAQNVVPRSQSLSSLHHSFSGSRALTSRVRSNSTLSASSGFTGGSTSSGNRIFSGARGPVGSAQHGSTFRFGNRFDRFDRFNRFNRFEDEFEDECWNCGFGFGFGFGGWGFGSPWLGFGLWDPFWYNSWAWGAGPTYGYGYPPNPATNVYVYPDSGYSTPDDNSNPPPQEYNQDGQGNSDGNWVTPNGPSPSSAPSSGTLNVPVLIYLKSGKVFTVRDYWITDEEFHYVLMNGVQNTVNLEQVDLPRTNVENAKSGVKFIFKSEPSIMVPEPDGNGMPPGAREPSPRTAPTQQMNVVPQPDART